MKPKTIDLLLDYYIKERIPNFDGILDVSTKDADASVFKERSHSFSFAPVPPPQESIGDASVKGRSHTFSFAPSPPPDYQNIGKNFAQGGVISIVDWEAQSLSQPYPSADVTDGLNNEERQRCKAVARKLIKIADEFKENHMSSVRGGNLNSSSHARERGYTPEEWSTLERIYSESSSLDVTRIASVLANCFTPRTVQAAVRFLSGQNDDVSQQLAMTLELSTHVVRQMGRRVLDTIRTVVTETFQHCTELEDL